MWRAAWKSVLGHKSRFLLSTLAVVFGVAFMVGALTFTSMISRVFEGISKGAIADVQVAAAGSFDGDLMARPPNDLRALTDDDLASFRQVEGVAEVVGVLRSMSVYPLDAEGQVTVIGRAPGLGFNHFDAPAFNYQPGIVVQAGHEPRTDDEVNIDPNTFARLGLELGDEIDIATPSGTVTKRLVGTASWGAGNGAGAMYTFFTTAEAQRLLLPSGTVGYHMAWVTTDSGADRVEIAEALNEFVPAGYHAYDGEHVAETLATFVDLGMTFINTFLMVFAVIGLVVAVFLIVNTFSILVTQRTRELALFRALGASKGQVGASVLFEAFVIGLIGGALGVLAGVGLAFGISSLLVLVGVDLSEIAPIPQVKTVAAALGVSVLVTMASAWLPAHRAGKIAPVAAIIGQHERPRNSFGRLEFGASVLALPGVAGMLAGVFHLERRQALVVGIGALLCLIAMTRLAPLIGRPLIWILGRVFRVGFGIEGKLADLNTMRQPRRTAATATALMIGLTMVTALSVLGSSAAISIDSLIRDSMRSDFDIGSVGFESLPGGLDEEVAAVPGVGEVVIVRNVMTSNLDGELQMLFSYEPRFFNARVLQTIEAGEVFGNEVGQVIVEHGFAADKGLEVGDSYQLLNPVTRAPIELSVTGIFSTPKGVSFGSINTNLETAAQMGNKYAIDQLGVLLAPDADPAQVKQGLLDVVGQYPMLKVLDREEYADQQTGMINQIFNLIYALLGLAIIIAILGIVNTLVLTTLERTRELGLLRAIGMQRYQLRVMVVLESVAISVLGAVLGILLGVGFGSALQRVLADDGLRILVVDWPQYAIFLSIAVGLGVIAAIWPAHRAARMTILDAIARE